MKKQNKDTHSCACCDSCFDCSPPRALLFSSCVSEFGHRSACSGETAAELWPTFAHRSIRKSQKTSVNLLRAAHLHQPRAKHHGRLFTTFTREKLLKLKSSTRIWTEPASLILFSESVHSKKKNRLIGSTQSLRCVFYFVVLLDILVSVFCSFIVCCEIKNIFNHIIQLDV